MPEADRPLRVFLCHSSNDKPVVRDLYRRLDAEGWVDVWLDEVKLFPGQDWNFEIEKAVEEADVILVCLTKNSVNKEGYVQRELRIVLDLADYKPEGTLFVIPVRLEECDPPRRLRSWQYADYFPKENRDAAYQRLLVSLGMRAENLGISTVNPEEEIVRHEAEEPARRQAEELKRKQAEEDTRQEKEVLDRKAAQDRAREESEERATKQKTEEQRLAKAKVDTGRKAKEKADRLAAQKAKAGGRQEQAEPGIEAARSQNTSQEETAVDERIRNWVKQNNLRPYGIGIGILLIAVLGIFGISSLIKNISAKETATPTFTQPPPVLTNTSILPTRTQNILINTPTVASTPIPTLGIGSTMIASEDGMVMVYVPAGEFMMGSDANDGLAECEKYYSECQPDWYIDEEPQHFVYLNAFWIDQTEVTNSMFAKFIADTDYVTDAEQAGESFVHQDGYAQIKEANWQHPLGPDSNISELLNYPVVHISWNDAKAYCEWAGRRLPSEAEWEKAASWDDANQKKYVYPWGNTFIGSFLNICDKTCSVVWLDYDDGFPRIAPVGSYLKGVSSYGVLDMAGNVAEWTADWYDKYPNGNPKASLFFGQIERVIRGGSWINQIDAARTVDRGSGRPSGGTVDTVGFRCAMSASE